MPGPFRQTDAVLTISQDNVRRAIEVTAANDVLGRVVGVEASELAGKPLASLLPGKIAEMLDDYVEFEDGANDVGDVLGKVRDFQLMDKDGKPRAFRLKIVRHHSVEHDSFLLILQDEAARETSALLEKLREHFEGHESRNADTGLPDRASLAKGLELVELHLENITNGVCFTVVELDQYEEILGKYGVQACHKLMQNVAGLCRQNLRDSDQIMQLDRHRLGIILIGAGREPARIVLNRLRWLVGGQVTRTAQGVDVQSTATIALREIAKGDTPDMLIEACEKLLEGRPESGMNLVVDA